MERFLGKSQDVDDGKVRVAPLEFKESDPITHAEAIRALAQKINEIIDVINNG